MNSGLSISSCILSKLCKIIAWSFFLNCGGGRQLKIGLVLIGLGCDACRCSRT